MTATVTAINLGIYRVRWKPIVGVLKQLNVVFKSSDVVCCCVNVTFDVACVMWVFGFCGIRKGPITLCVLWDETEGRVGGEVI